MKKYTPINKVVTGSLSQKFQTCSDTQEKNKGGVKIYQTLFFIEIPNHHAEEREVKVHHISNIKIGIFKAREMWF